MRGGLHFIGGGGGQNIRGRGKQGQGGGRVASVLGLRWEEGNELDMQGEPRERKNGVWVLRLVFFYSVSG